MNFQNPVELIKKRTSIRTYKKDVVPEITKEELKKSFNQIKQSPFGELGKFFLLDIKDLKGRKVKLGTYGIIKNAPSFVVGIVENGRNSYENYGFQFEQIILKATELGLGTCWLGGTFKKQDFINIINIKDNEILPAVTPIGYPSNKKSITDTLTRTLAGSSKRKPFEDLFFDGEFGYPLPMNISNPYSEVLEMVRLAPSAGNTQPWRIVRDSKSNIYHLYKMFTNVLYENSNLNMIDMGIAMCHFQLTVEYKGLEGEWRCENPHLLNLPDKTNYVISWFGE